MDQREEKLTFLQELLADQSWETVSNNEEILLQRRFLKNSPIACFKASGIVDADAESLVKFVWDTYNDESGIKKYDTDMASYTVVENFDENTRLCYQINNLSWPLWSRDVSYLQCKIVDGNACEQSSQHDLPVKGQGNTTYILMWSVDSNATPRQDDKYVRAHINVSAYVFEQRDNGCMVHRIAHIDPAGVIPVSIINSYAEKTTHMIKNLRAEFCSF